MRRLAHLALWPAGAAFGLASLAIARDDPDWSLAGDSAARALVETAAGWALLAVGLVAWARRSPPGSFGPALVAASFAWLAAEWNTPAAGSSLVFTVGLLFGASAPPLVAWAALSVGGAPSTVERVLLGATALATAGMLGLLPALLLDPAAGGCALCPTNVLALGDEPGADRWLHENGVRLLAVCAPALTLLVLARLARSSRVVRRQAAPVLLPAAVYLGAVTASAWHSLERGFLGIDDVDRTLRLIQAAALLALAAGTAWGWLRERRTRETVARVVVEQASAPPAGGVRDALATALGDPALRIAYVLADGRRVDVHGRPVESSPDAAITPLRRGEETVAQLLHGAGVTPDAARTDSVVAAARLALEHERLRAETRAQLADLRASRVRVVQTADSVRQSLERDLHDGAQQRLVGLMLALRLGRAERGASLDEPSAERIGRAEEETRLALAELRDLAHGIYPAALAEEGLESALETLAERSAVPMALRQLPRQRYDPAIEAAAYFVVAQLARRHPAERLGVAVDGEDGVLRVAVDGLPDGPAATEIEDRVGALDGTVTLAGGTLLVEIPCAS